MHSKRKLKAEYPDIDRVALLQVYTGTFHRKPQLVSNATLVAQMKSINYDEFLIKTSASMDMLGCRYMDRSCVDKRGGSRIWWKEEYTRYGMCLIFNPDHDFYLAEKVIYLKYHQSKTISLENSNRPKSCTFTWYWI